MNINKSETNHIPLKGEDNKNITLSNTQISLLPLKVFSQEKLIETPPGTPSHHPSLLSPLMPSTNSRLTSRRSQLKVDDASLSKNDQRWKGMLFSLLQGIILVFGQSICKTLYIKYPSLQPEQIIVFRYSVAFSFTLITVNK